MDLNLKFKSRIDTTCRSTQFWNDIIRSSLKIPAVNLDPPNLIDGITLIDDVSKVEKKPLTIESNFHYEAPTVETGTSDCDAESPVAECKALIEWRLLAVDKALTTKESSQPVCVELRTAEQQSSSSILRPIANHNCSGAF